SPGSRRSTNCSARWRCWSGAVLVSSPRRCTSDDLRIVASLMSPVAELDLRATQAHRVEEPAALPFGARSSAEGIGVAEQHAHHGEIVQGAFYDNDGRLERGLVTLPCELYATRVRFRPMRRGCLTVDPGDRAKARTAARLTLEALGRLGWGGAIRI